MQFRSLGLIVAPILGVAALFAEAQQDRSQFRTGVELIQLDVAVLDDKRQPVRGLTQAEFTVLENGVTRPIRAFTPVELASRARAGRAVWADSVSPDVVTNQVGDQEGRLVVILLDRSIPVEHPTLVARRIAAGIVDSLGPHDLAAVVSTSNGAVQNLTADRSRLLRAINAGELATGLSPEQEAVFGKLDPLTDGRCLCGLCVLETMTRVADALQNTPRRRKMLFFIGSTIIWQSARPIAQAKTDPGCETRLKDARNTLFAAVDRANVTVHSIDPKGLVNIGPQTRAGIGGGFDRPVSSGPAVRLQKQQTDTNDSLTDRHSLEVLPARTGGRTIAGRNDPEHILPAIFQESEAYYVLGIERPPSGKDDALRDVEVKVGRRGMRAYAQRRYAVPPTRAAASSGAPPASTPPTIEEALGRLIPAADLSLALSVTAFASPQSAKAIVRVNVDAGAFAPADGTAAPLEVAVMAVDPAGRQLASARQTSTVAARPTPDKQSDVNVQSHLELAPGDYGIRVAVGDPATGKTASVFSDVTIPRFDDAVLSLSGIMVDVADALAAGRTPTTRRLFDRKEQVRALLQIYQGTARSHALRPVTMRVKILDAKGTAVRDQSLSFTETMFADRRADCVITIPVANLRPGEYLLQLDASLDRDTAGRALRFAVE